MLCSACVKIPLNNICLWTHSSHGSLCSPYTVCSLSPHHALNSSTSTCSAHNAAVSCLYFSSESISEHLQLLRSRYLEPHERNLRSSSSMFDLQKLQEDIIKVYLVGKPLIEDPADHLRVCFKFRVVPPDSIAMGISEVDLQILHNDLIENFKVSRYEWCFRSNSLLSSKQEFG